MNQYIGQKVLITAQSWFYGPDGKLYRAAWGTLKGVHEASKIVGFIPNRAHANWFLEIGDLTIMGCQVMYVLKCEKQPPEGPVKDYLSDAANGLKEFDRPGNILILE